MKFHLHKNIEIILVDDGSTDSSGGMCDDFAAADPRITVIHKKNGGLSDARNVGIDKAKGDYIGFVDSDDWICGEFFEVLLRELLNADADISVCERVYAEPYGFFDCGVSGSVEVLDSGAALDIMYADEKYRNHAWNKLYKRHLFNNIRFPAGRLYEDVYVMHEIFGNASSVVFIDRGMYYYRQRPDSIVHTNTKHSWDDFIGALETREQSEWSLTRGKALFIAWTEMLERLMKADMTDHYDKKWLHEVKEKVRKRYRSEYGYSRIKLIAITKLYPLLNFSRSFRKRRLAENIRFRRQNKRIHLGNNDGLPRIILMGSPETWNMGDEAIAYSIRKFVSDIFPKTEFIEIPDRYLKKNIYPSGVGKNDIILLMGGGNFGSLYMDQEDIHIDVMRRFKDNNIVMFPQSLIFTEDPAGSAELERAVDAVAKHGKTFIFARENYSYGFLRSNFTPAENFQLCPDIVFYNEFHSMSERKGVFFCMRSDRESSLTSSERDNLLCDAYGAFGDVTAGDTVLLRDVSFAERDREVNRILEHFSRYRLVMTDRLHGVIFSAVTGTPCVAFTNNNYKIKGICRWTEELGFVQYTDDSGEMCRIGRELMDRYPAGSEKRVKKESFECVKNIVRRCLGGADEKVY